MPAGEALALVERLEDQRGFLLADARREVLADAGDLAQAGLVEQRQLVRMVAGDIGAVAVGADLERVLALDLEKVRHFPEDARDRGVIHTAARRLRSGSQGFARRRRRAP